MIHKHSLSYYFSAPWSSTGSTILSNWTTCIPEHHKYNCCQELCSITNEFYDKIQKTKDMCLWFLPSSCSPVNGDRKGINTLKTFPLFKNVEFAWFLIREIRSSSHIVPIQTIHSPKENHSNAYLFKLSYLYDIRER